MQPVVVIGIGAEGLDRLAAGATQAIASATFLAGGRRHLALVGPIRGEVETFAITNNVSDLVDRLARRSPAERCVVLASGDPLFFGIGHALVESLGREQVRIEPAVSSMQLAFARAGVAWHEATVASLHGRPFAKTLFPLLGRRCLGLFTNDGWSPARVAEFFVSRGLDDYDAWVAERLGGPEERVTALPLPELLGRAFDDLNVLVLRRRGVPEWPVSSDRVPGLPDALFARPETGPVLLSHADVRAVTLTRFRALPEGPIWDVGAGLGGVAVELARAFPDREVVAVERAEAQRAYLAENRRRFSAYNLRIVEGEAPGAVQDEADSPAGLFLGGSGGRLDAILDLTFDRLVSGGVFVGNFVALENLSRCLDRLRAGGWRAEVTQVQISPSQPLAGLSVLTPLRPVWVVNATRA